MALGNYSTNEDGKTIVQVSDPTSAYLGKSIIIELYRNFNHINVFLGPKLQNQPISLPDLMEDDDEPSDIMNMDKFLAENYLHFDIEPQHSPMWGGEPVPPPTQVVDIKPQTRPSIIVAPKSKLLNEI